MADGKVNPAGGSGTKEARDSACTPKWLADLIGKVDLDVASNGRAHIQAAVSLIGDNGDNGLFVTQERGYSQRVSGGWGIDRSAIVKADTVVFCNPPYARGQVIRWVKHWRTTRFIFLLRWDPSTAWFAELIGHCTHVWFPGRRINFEPPPGVTFSSNPFPHALYLRNPDQALIDRLSNAGFLLPIDEALLDFYLAGDNPAGDDQRTADSDDEPGDEGEGTKGGGGAGGGSAGGAAKGIQPEGIAKWIPATEKPKKWGVDFAAIKKEATERSKWWDTDYADIYKFRDELRKVEDHYAQQRRKREEEAGQKAKANGSCGECVDCKYGLGWCVFKTKQYREEF